MFDKLHARASPKPQTTMSGGGSKSPTPTSGGASKPPTPKPATPTSGGGLKKPLLALNRLVGHSSAKNHMSRLRLGSPSALEQLRDSTREAEKAQRELVLEQEKRAEKERVRQYHEEREAAAHADDPPAIAERYGTTTDEAHVLGAGREGETRLAALVDGKDEGALVGATIHFVARLHHVRRVSAKLAFLVFRQQIDTLQGVLTVREGAVSENFVRWAEHLTTESLVRVSGVLRAPVPGEPVRGCSIHSVELHIETLHVLVGVDESPPVDVHAIDRVEEDPATHETTYVHPAHMRTADNRVSFLRTPTMQAVMRVRATVCALYRETLTRQGFLEVHTPKLQPAATESGAEVFPVKYFGRTAYLAQSPQLAKQLCMSADLGRVFEIGSVFRAENSNTHRHLTEYVSLDLEMVLTTDYHEAMYIIDGLLKAIFRGVYARHRREIDIIKTHFPHEDLVIPDETVVLPFRDAVAMLNESGWRDEQGQPASPLEDLSTPAEIRLGELVKAKYGGTDYYILDKFPRAARPFYAHPDPADPTRYTNSFDIFLRGQEIVTGGQRIHDVRELRARMAEANIDPADMEEYVQGFSWAVLPHAGCGIGLERVLFLMLGLRDVRNATLFPRDPKSLPARPPSTRPKLAHPEADTIQYAVDYERAMSTAAAVAAAAKAAKSPAKAAKAAKRRSKQQQQLVDAAASPPKTSMSSDAPSASSTTTTTAASTAPTTTTSAPRDSGDGSIRSPSSEAATPPQPPPLPPVEKLIANYGDATNTSWLDDRYRVWRHASTGAAVGYAVENGYALIMGDPLCDRRQFGMVIAAFLHELRSNMDLRPLWLLASAEVEKILGRQLGWNTMSCVAEERVQVDEVRRVRRKERQAEEAGVTIHYLDKGDPVPDELRARCDARIADWKASRRGTTQVHITEVRPWVDLPHRRFVWAEDRDGRVCALVVLHDLAPVHGVQIKFALNFPGAPHGAIELAIAKAITRLASAGIKSVTFGAGATHDMEFGANLHGTVRAKILSRTYRTISEQLKLYQKSEFREKFGAVEDPVYICYPHLGLGVSGARTLIKFFEDEMYEG